jgi:DNA-binding response OmpR family regulator
MVSEHYASRPPAGGSIHDFFTAASQHLHPERPNSRQPADPMTEHADTGRTIRVDDLEITPDEGLVRAGGHVLTLSVRELQLLVAMVEHAGGIVGRAELCRAVWGRELRLGDRSVDVYVSKLRAKLEHVMPDRRYIHTHPSFGYRFQSEPSQDLDIDGAARAQTGSETASGRGAA